MLSQKPSLFGQSVSLLISINSTVGRNPMILAVALMGRSQIVDKFTVLKARRVWTREGR